MTGVGVSIMWCEAVRQSIARYQVIDVWPDGGPVDPITRRAQRAEAFVLVMVANQLQRSLDAPGLRHLRKRLPHVDLYRLRCLYEHGDEKAERKYRDKVGPNARWRSGLQIGDVDFGEVLGVIEAIEHDLYTIAEERRQAPPFPLTPPAQR